MGLEPTTTSLATRYSTTELHPHSSWHIALYGCAVAVSRGEYLNGWHWTGGILSSPLCCASSRPRAGVPCAVVFHSSENHDPRSPGLRPTTTLWKGPPCSRSLAT